MGLLLKTVLQQVMLVSCSMDIRVGVPVGFCGLGILIGYRNNELIQYLTPILFPRFVDQEILLIAFQYSAL